MPLSDLRPPPRHGGHFIGARTSRRSRPDKTGFEVVWARDEDDVRQAQQLRHLVFAEEMGARLSPCRWARLPATTSTCSTRFCEHLLVRATATTASRAR